MLYLARLEGLAQGAMLIPTQSDERACPLQTGHIGQAGLTRDRPPVGVGRKADT